jgi:hypothetical protein
MINKHGIVYYEFNDIQLIAKKNIIVLAARTRTNMEKSMTLFYFQRDAKCLLCLENVLHYCRLVVV